MSTHELSISWLAFNPAVVTDGANPPDNREIPHHRLAVTGTPGTGKTSATKLLDTDRTVHLNELIRDEHLWQTRDESRGAVEADLEAVRARLDGWEGIVESHLAHYLSADAVVVLRCHPNQLESRLRERGASQDKIAENAESEALDVILSEAVSHHSRDTVYEIDTTEMAPTTVAGEIRAVMRGTRSPSTGIVDFTDFF